jgi:hypothetical protein
MDRKLIATATIADTYGDEFVKLELLTRGRHAGRYVTRGAGYAGRIAYASEDRARSSVASDRRFRGWSAA